MKINEAGSKNKKDALHLLLACFLGVILGIGLSSFFPSLATLFQPHTWRDELATVYDFTKHDHRKDSDRLIIKFRGGQSEAQKQKVLSAVRWTEIKKLHGSDAIVLTIIGDDTADEVAGRIRSVYGAHVAYAEADALLPPEYIPNDPEIGSAWHIGKMNIPQAWDSAKGEGVIVAILDTGVDCAHSDLSTNCLPGWNVVTNSPDTADVYGHGTMVAGISGGVGDNALQVAGVAYGAKLLPVRVSNDSTGGYAYLSDIASGIHYASDHGAKVVNISYQVADSQLIADAVAYLYRAGGLAVVSAGNDGARSNISNSQEMIVVAGTVFDDTKATWSSYGPLVDVSAPGLGIYTTGRGGTLAVMSGTSASAPNVSGLVALLYSLKPTATPAEISYYLFAGAFDLGTTGYDESYGWGRVDAGASIQYALSASSTSTYTPPPTTTDPFSLLSFAVTKKTATGAMISWSTTLPATGVVRYGVSQSNLAKETSASISQTDQTITMSGLTPRTKYYYQIVATSTSGATVSSTISTFRTGSK